MSENIKVTTPLEMTRQQAEDELLLVLAGLYSDGSMVHPGSRMGEERRFSCVVISLKTLTSNFQWEMYKNNWNNRIVNDMFLLPAFGYPVQVIENPA